jgi:hypothetical protein
VFAAVALCKSGPTFAEQAVEFAPEVPLVAAACEADPTGELDVPEVLGALDEPELHAASPRQAAAAVIASGIFLDLGTMGASFRCWLIDGADSRGGGCLLGGGLRHG